MFNKSLILSEAEHMIFRNVQMIADGLASYLGEGCEIIIHSLETPHNSAITVINGHHSGRSIGAPITNLAIRMLENFEKGTEKTPFSYFNKAKDGTPIKSITIPILGDGNRVIGMMCINFYMDISVFDYFSTFMPNNRQSIDEQSPIEYFSHNTDDLITDSVTEIRNEVMDNDQITAANKHKEIIAQLEKRGIFNIKDAVVKVANQLGISKNTVYMHLRNIRNQ